MANRLAELHQAVHMKPGAKPVKRTARPVALGAVSYTVPGEVPPLKQETENVCWATVATMLLSWRRQQSLSVGVAMASVGQRYVDLFKGDKRLAASEKPVFLAAAGLVAMAPQNPTIEGWESLLRQFGPLWVTTAEPGIHARVMLGIRGDGTPAGTAVDIIDPSTGTRFPEPFQDFLRKFEKEAATTGALRVQIAHWPRDAGVAVAHALSDIRSRATQLSRAQTADLDLSEAEPEVAELDPRPRRRRVIARSLAKRPAMGASDVAWAADADSPDYRHLGQAGVSQYFGLDGSVLERLASLNRFDVTVGQDQVVFGLRGCTLDADVPAFAKSVQVTETIPNHYDNNCVIGVWKRSTKEIACFQASTVPNWKYMEKHRQEESKANMLPTGRYLCKVGTHRKGTSSEVEGALLEAEERMVLRTFDDLTYTVRDEWDRGWVGDNIHAGYNTINTGGSTAPDFSSAGCQTVPGGPGGGKPTGSWAAFRTALGLDNKNLTAHDGRLFVYVLLTGREARLAAGGAGATALTRLRFGSSGVDVTALQLGLKAAGHSPGGADGKWGAGTSAAYVKWQQLRDGGAADGVVTPSLGLALGFDFVNQRSVAVP